VQYEVDAAPTAQSPTIQGERAAVALGGKAAEEFEKKRD